MKIYNKQQKMTGELRDNVYYFEGGVEE